MGHPPQPLSLPPAPKPPVPARRTHSLTRKLLYFSRAAQERGVSLQFNTTRVNPDIVVVQLTGSILLWPEGQIGIINQLLEQNERKLILDLSGIEHMDSSGAELMFECLDRKSVV